jgi:hypothetical protein
LCTIVSLFVKATGSPTLAINVVGENTSPSWSMSGCRADELSPAAADPRNSITEGVPATAAGATPYTPSGAAVVSGGASALGSPPHAPASAASAATAALLAVTHVPLCDSCPREL